MRLGDLAVIIHQQISAVAMQHAGLAAGDGGSMTAGFEARACGFHADDFHILVIEERLSVRDRGNDRQREVCQPICGEGQVLVAGSQGTDLILADGRDEDRVVDTLFCQLHKDRDVRNERSFLVLRVLFNQIYELRVVHVTATVTVPTNPVEMRSLGVRLVSYACAPPMGLKPH